MIHHPEYFHFKKVADDFLTILVKKLDVRIASHLMDHGYFEILFGGEG